MKRLFIILTSFLIFINTAFGAQKIVTKDMNVVSADGFRLTATLKYPKSKITEYKTVVLLHSLGYNSEWWENLPETLLNDGYAVLLIDLRGHGKSVYNSKLSRVSWTSLTNNAYAKYPTDVINIMEYVKNENPKRKFFNNWAIIGSDIGAVTGIAAANKSKFISPKTIVMLSPIVKAKSLYAPVNIAELTNVDFLSICGITDTSSFNNQEYLKKFAQASFAEYTSTSKASGMLMLKNDPTLIPFITKWIEEYLK